MMIFSFLAQRRNKRLKKEKNLNPSHYSGFKNCQMQDGPVCHDMGLTSFKSESRSHSLSELDRAGVNWAMASLKGWSELYNGREQLRGCIAGTGTHSPEMDGVWLAERDLSFELPLLPINCTVKLTLGPGCVFVWMVAKWLQLKPVKA